MGLKGFATDEKNFARDKPSYRWSNDPYTDQKNKVEDLEAVGKKY